MKGWTNFARSVSVERDMVIDGTNNETDKQLCVLLTNESFYFNLTTVTLF